MHPNDRLGPRRPVLPWFYIQRNTVWQPKAIKKEFQSLLKSLKALSKGRSSNPADADAYKALSSFLFLSPEPGILPTFAFFPSHCQLPQLSGRFPSPPRLFLGNSLHKCLRLWACLFSPFSLTSPPPLFPPQRRTLARTLQPKPWLSCLPSGPSLLGSIPTHRILGTGSMLLRGRWRGRAGAGESGQAQGIPSQPVLALPR